MSAIQSRLTRMRDDGDRDGRDDGAGVPDDGARVTDGGTRVVDRMLALWRRAARCQPAPDAQDPSATLVPAASPRRTHDVGALAGHGDRRDASAGVAPVPGVPDVPGVPGVSDATDDAAPTRRWSAHVPARRR